MLYFITGNPNKFAEAQAILPQLEQLEIDLPEIQELDPHKIIEAKLQAAFVHQAAEFIVEDTSLYFEGLNGLPGPLIKWFLQALGTEGLARLALQSGNAKVVAKTIIGYAKNPEQIEFFEGSIEGTVCLPRGTTTFGWDPIFLPNGYHHSFAEMSREEKNTISMRRLAFEKLRTFL